MSTKNTSGTSSPSAGASSSRSKRKPNNDLFRNYYGLDKNNNDGTASSPSKSNPAAVGIVDGMTDSNNDPINPDSESFQIDLAFKTLMQKHSLAQLIKEESDLLTDIRELDGERQSLVYNHHHELVFASETMKNMKDQADGLLPSLNAMQSSLQSISSTSESLILSESDVQQQRQNHSGSKDILKRAQPVIQLPQRLRDLILLEKGGKGLNKAQGLWGSLESVLASWDEAGVKGAKEIMNECRQVLREAQHYSSSVKVA